MFFVPRTKFGNIRDLASPRWRLIYRHCDTILIATTPVFVAILIRKTMWRRQSNKSFKTTNSTGPVPRHFMTHARSKNCIKIFLESLTMTGVSAANNQRRMIYQESRFMFCLKPLEVFCEERVQFVAVHRSASEERFVFFMVKNKLVNGYWERKTTP